MDRRELLNLSLGSALTVGVGASLWVVMGASGPSGPRPETAKIRFSTIKLDGRQIVKVWNMPIQLIRYSLGVPDERGSADFGDVFSRARTSAETALHNKAREPAYVETTYRSLRPGLFVSVACCTLDGLLLTKGDGPTCAGCSASSFLSCPGCGSRFDRAGRPYYGPAMLNLLVPPYRVDGDVITLGEAPVGEPFALGPPVTEAAVFDSMSRAERRALAHTPS